jgi:hypothetical protein
MKHKTPRSLFLPHVHPHSFPTACNS